MTPGRNKIFVKQLEPETHTASGIAIPENAQKKQKYGHVVAIGDYNTLEYGELQIGDQVSFGENAGEKVLFDDEELLVMHPGVFYSVLKDGKHQAFGSVVIVELESVYKKTQSVGGVELLLDVPILKDGEQVFFNKRERLESFGTVISVPQIQPKDGHGNEIESIIKEGDKIYFRYMNVADTRAYLEKSVSDFSEKFTIRVPYEDVFCIVRDGQILPVGEWILGEAFIDGDGQDMDMPTGNGGTTTIKVTYTKSGLVESVNDKVSINKAIVRHVGSLKNKPSVLKKGDIIFSKIGVNFENTIEGKSYYCFLESFQVDAVIGSKN